MNESDSLLDVKEHLLNSFENLIQSSRQTLKLNFINESFDKNRINENVIKITLPNFIVDRVIDKPQSSELYHIIRCLISEHKNYFIEFFENYSKNINDNKTQNSDSKQHINELDNNILNDVNTYADQFICDLENSIDKTESPPRVDFTIDGNSDIYQNFASNLIQSVCTDTYDKVETVNKFANNFVDNLFDETFENLKCENEKLHEESNNSNNSLKFSLLNSSPLIPRICISKSKKIFRRHSADIASVQDRANILYDEEDDNEDSHNSSFNSNDSSKSSIWINRRHSLHSTDHLRKLNDLTKQYKKQIKAKLNSKKIIVNKSISSSIGVDLNSNIGSSNESLNKSFVKQYAKLTLKSILHKNDKKKSKDKFNETRLTKYLNSSSYVNNLISNVFSDAFDDIRIEYRIIENTIATSLTNSIMSDALKNLETLNFVNNKCKKIFFICNENENIDSCNHSLHLNCLLSIYSLIIALNECNFENEATFICPHFYQ